MTAEQLMDFLQEWSALDAEIGEQATVRMINADLITSDAKAQQAYQEYTTHIQPEHEKASAALKEKLLALEDIPWPQEALHLLKGFQVDASLFNEKNLQVMQELSLLEQEYVQINGSFRIEFEGATRTLPQMHPFLFSADRQERERAWRATAQAHTERAPQLDDLFLKMLKLRRTLAINTGHSDYRAYIWDRYHRFDYTPDDCLKFHQTVLQEVVPLAKSLMEKQRKILNVDVLRPWDAYWYDLVEPADCLPLQPFQTASELENKLHQVFDGLSPELGQMFQHFRDHAAMDLAASDDKLPQAYCTCLSVKQLPFVFENVLGYANDVSVSLHEFGHAFHIFKSMQNQSLIWNQGSVTEFAEVPSTAMELLALDHLEVFYTPDELQRVKRSSIWKMVHILPWACVLDAFQHWLYAEAPEDVTPEMLDRKMLELVEQYQPMPSWEGLEWRRKKMWQFFHVIYLPFYYIEYAFSTLGALQMWRNQQEDAEKTLNQYLESLKWGNTLAVPELYRKAGISFRFDAEMVREVVAFVRKQM